MDRNILSVMGLNRGVDISGFFAAIISLVLLLILLGSISVIYNSFSISVSERSRQYGLLKSVGATPLQLRNSVYYEAFAVSLAGIPLGLLAGYFGMGFVMRMLRSSFAGMLSEEVQFRAVMDTGMMIESVLLILLVVMISAMIPALRSSRMTVVDSIRQTADIRNRRKEKRRSRALFTDLFGFEAALALKNLRRSGRKYITAIVSLAVSVSIILSFASFGGYAKKSGEAMFGVTTYDLELQPLSETVDPLVDRAVLEFLSTSELVKSYSKVLLLDTFDLQVHEDTLSGRNTRVFEGIGSLKAFVYCLEDEAFRRYADTAGFDPASCTDPENPRVVYIRKNGGYINTYSEAKKYSGELLNVKIGSTYELKINPKPDTLATLEVGALADVLPIGLTTQRNECIFVLPQSGFDKVMHEYLDQYSLVFPRYYVDLSEAADGEIGIGPALYQFLNKRGLSFEFTTYDQRSARRREQGMNAVVSTFSIVYIAVICLIGVLNVYNTINTAMELRRRELFLYKSVGMTPAGLSKMLDRESAFFSLAALLFGLPAGVLASFYIYRAYINIADLGFRPPWTAMVLCAVGVWLLVYAVMALFKHRIRGESIIDTIRQENI